MSYTHGMWTLPGVSPARLLTISEQLDAARLAHAFGGSVALEAWGIPDASGAAELHVFADQGDRATAIATLGLTPTASQGAGGPDTKTPLELLESSRSRRNYRGIQIPVLGAEAIVTLAMAASAFHRDAILVQLIAARGFAFDESTVRKHLSGKAIARFDALLGAALRADT